MICPTCTSDDNLVIESRKSPLGIRRRRNCQACGHRWSTVEVNRADLIEVAIREADRARRPKSKKAARLGPPPSRTPRANEGPKTTPNQRETR